MLTKLYMLSAPGSKSCYIGKTSHPLSTRLSQHLWEARTTKRNHRLNWLRRYSSLVEIHLIATVAGNGSDEEISIISGLKALGVGLVNGTGGGEGGQLGVKRPEVAAKVAAKLRGKRLSPESAAKSSAYRTKGVPALLAKFKGLRDAGWQYREIADKFGLSAGVVFKYLKVGV